MELNKAGTVSSSASNNDPQTASNEHETLKELPEALMKFCERYDIDPETYLNPKIAPRYIWLNPLAPDPIEPSPESVARALSLSSPPPSVAGLPGWFALDSNTSIAQLEQYKSGRVFAADAASGVAVAVLDVQPGHHVLDVCAAPGAKLAMSAVKVGAEGSVTGMDVHQNRLSVARNMCGKYGLTRVRLFAGDARRGAPLAPLPNPSTVFSSRGRAAGKGVKRRWNQIANEASELQPSVADRTIMQIWAGAPNLQESSEESSKLYDRVLVDAECTTDGSVRHMLRAASSEKGKSLPTALTDVEAMNAVAVRQREFLEAGWAALSPGGRLVYATCSLTRLQNESVVGAFLEKHSEASLVELNPSIYGCMAGELKGTLRFHPLHHPMSGLFIAALTKRQ